MRLRLRYEKRGKVRFTSHRDTARVWERVLRKAAVPVGYSGGFSPRPRLSFGLALPTGAESVAEYLDVELDGDRAAEVDLDAVRERLSAALPAGMPVAAAALVDRGALSLQEAVTSCGWRIEARNVRHDDAERLVQAALRADELVVTRQRKGREVTDDLRPAILSLSVAGPTSDGTELHAELAVHPRSVRPAELITALSPHLEEGHIERTHQWIERDGARVEPLPQSLPPHATSAPRAEVRA